MMRYVALGLVVVATAGWLFWLRCRGPRDRGVS